MHAHTADPTRPTRPVRAHTRTSRARNDATAYYTQQMLLGRPDMDDGNEEKPFCMKALGLIELMDE